MRFIARHPLGCLLVAIAVVLALTALCADHYAQLVEQAQARHFGRILQ